MPFVAGTPESLEASLQRRDSKDFSSTCRGINQNGSPCRTKISAKVSALKTTIDGKEAYFCWRHKEQASALIQKKSKAWDASGRRGSMDILVEKVLEMAVTDDVKPSGATAATASVTTVKLNEVKKTTTHTPPGGAYPFPPVPIVYEPPPSIPPLPPASSHKHKVVKFLNGLFNRISNHHNKKRNPNLFLDDDDDSDEADDSSPATAQPPQPPQQPSHSPPSLTSLFKRKLLSKVRFDTTPLAPPLPHMVPESHQRPHGQPPPSALSPPRKPKSQIPGYMSRKKLATLIAQSKTAVIPPHLTPATRKVLHETLSKPFSTSDTPGYIYIFALLPSSPNRPPAMPTASTIDPNDPTSQTAPRVLLKIGRTVNVASRLNQHANQCNYDPTLIRFYPHPDSKSVAKGDAVVRKVPNVNRIERLIHLELRDDPQVYPDELRHKCNVCGKIHKEWFSVEATEEGVKWVDGVIARWIAWGEYWGGDGDGAKRTREEEEAALRRGEKIAREAMESEEESGEEEMFITGKVETKTPPKRGRKESASTGETSLKASPVKKSPRAKSAAPVAERPSPPARGEGNLSVDRAKPKPRSRSASASTPASTSKKSPAKSPAAARKKKAPMQEGISDDDFDSDASYHDAQSGETEDEESGDEEEWVEGGKVETRSPNWKKGKGGAGGKGKGKKVVGRTR